MDKETLGLLRLLLARIERLSADSFLAHRASGVRGSLLRVMEAIEQGRQPDELAVKNLLDIGFEILEKAGREISGIPQPKYASKIKTHSREKK
jgi:hypothetical protein